MINLYDKFCRIISRPYLWITLLYCIPVYFFGGYYGRKTIAFVMVVILALILIHYADRLVFDPALRWIERRERRRERERMHETTPRWTGK